MRNACLLALIVHVALLSPLWAETPAKEKQPQWIAVVAPGLRDVVTPLAEHRRHQGFSVVMMDASETGGDAQKLCDKVRQQWRSWDGPSYVLLVGVPNADGVGQQEAVSCVAPMLSGSVDDMAGELTDNGYGCRDGELEPAVAVGRLPARSLDEARVMVDKTLAWERLHKPGQWKRRFVILAGAPSFNPIVDRMAEAFAMSKIGALSPNWVGNAIYRNDGSRWTLPDGRVVAQAREYLGLGQLLTLYIGHSNSEGFWWDSTNAGWSMATSDDGQLTLTLKPDSFLFSSQQWADVKLPETSGVFVSFGCYGARLGKGGGEGEGYGVSALRNPNGPVAVIGVESSNNAAIVPLLADGLLTGWPKPTTPARLSDVWLAMKHHLAEGPINPLLYKALNEDEGKESAPSIERNEHQEMLHLLGDPALRLPCFTRELTLETTDAVAPDGEIAVRAKTSTEIVGGAGVATLERWLIDPPTEQSPLSDDLDDAERDRRVTANHRASNQFVLDQAKAELKDGVWTATLHAPRRLPWSRLIVRLLVTTKDADAMGTKAIVVVDDEADAETAAARE